MGITETLCQALQKKSQDILNAISTTKRLLQQFREHGCDTFLKDVTSFCESKGIEIPDMNSTYKVARLARGKSIHQPHDINITIGHHFRYDIYVKMIDTQLQKLNFRFNDHTVELLTLCTALDPRDSYNSFNVDYICTLAEKYYPEDFTDQERIILKFQSQLYYFDVIWHPDFRELSTIVALCETLAKTNKSQTYHLVDRLIRLILLLPVSMATTERAFSAMKLTKTRLRNKMEDEFLGDCMLLHIEQQIADSFSTGFIIDDFYAKKKRRSQLK